MKRKSDLISQSNVTHRAQKKGVRFQVLGCDVEPERTDIIQDLESVHSWDEMCESTIEGGKLVPLGPNPAHRDLRMVFYQ